MKVYPEIEIIHCESEVELAFRLVDAPTGDIVARRRYRVAEGDVLSWKKLFSDADVYDV